MPVYAATETAAAATTKETVYPGWQQDGEKWSWYLKEYEVLKDAVTPDGYYVNEDGAWFKTKQSVLDEQFTLPDRFRTASDIKSMEQVLSDVDRLNKKLQKKYEGLRTFHVYSSYVTYTRTENKEETILLGLYRDTASDGWKIRVSCNLSGSRDDYTRTPAIDYAVLRFLAGRFSHTPGQIADAIYQSWQGENAWHLSSAEDKPVGDSMIRYSVENGAAVYQIQKRAPK
jgi:hypothetical protein